MNLLPRLSPLQLFIICVNSAFGMSMITLPRSVAKVANEDMWLSVVVGGIVFLFAVWAVTRLSAYFPQHTCIEYHCILLGPVWGQIINILLIVTILSVPVVSVRTFSMAVKMYLLDITPYQILIPIILLLSVYAIQYGLDPFIRLQQFIFVPSYFIFLILICMGFLAVNTKNYQPFLADGFTPVLKGAIPSWFCYTGPEFVIGLLYSYITKKQYVFKWGAASVVVLTVLYTLITLVVQGILGATETSNFLTPTVIAYRAVEIPDTFIERIDGYLMMFWIPIVFTFVINFFYLASFAIGRMLKLESNRSVSILLVPVLYYGIVAPPNFQTATIISEFANMLLIVWGLGILPLLLGMAWLKEKRRRPC